MEYRQEQNHAALNSLMKSRAQDTKRITLRQICRRRGNRDMPQKGKSRYDEERTLRKKELINACLESEIYKMSVEEVKYTK